MPTDFELLGPGDKPALLVLSTPAWLEAVRGVVSGLGYKVQAAKDHDDFDTRFARVQYQLVVVETQFAGSSPGENRALRTLQRMPMGLRRFAVTVLIGSEYQTLNPMQAFQQSVHTVVNPADLGSLGPILQQTVADQDLRMSLFRDAQLRLVQGK